MPRSISEVYAFFSSISISQRRKTIWEIHMRAPKEASSVKKQFFPVFWPSFHGYPHVRGFVRTWRSPCNITRMSDRGACARRGAGVVRSLWCPLAYLSTRPRAALSMRGIEMIIWFFRWWPGRQGDRHALTMDLLQVLIFRGKFF